MEINFNCAECGADFELEIAAVVENPKLIKCSNCRAQPPAHRSHAFATALEDLLAAMAAIRTKVGFELVLITEELPPPYGKIDDADAGGLDGGLEFEDEDEYEDEDEEEDEDDLDGFQEEDIEGDDKPPPAAAPVFDDDDDEEEDEEEDDFDDDADEEEDDFDDDFDDEEDDFDDEEED